MHRAAETSTEAALMSLLRAFVRRSRWQTFWLRVMDAVILLTACACGLMLIHHAWPLPSLVREIACDVLIAAAIARVLPAAARLPRRDINLVAAAERLERCLPTLQQRLSTWASCRIRGADSPRIAELQVQLNAQFNDPTDCLQRCLPWSRIGQRVLVAVAFVIAALLIHRAGHVQLLLLLPPWN